MKTIKNLLTAYDDYYSMLSDKVRMDAYELAIKSVIKLGDIVVDLGAGTGILAFMALKAGAERVYIIEKSNAIDLAKTVAEENGLTEKTVFIQENSKAVNLPEKADVIISETLGSFGIDENTVEFIIDARERFLKLGGRLLPEGIQLYLAPACDFDVYKKLDFWNDIKGISFKSARDTFSGKLMVENIEKCALLSDAKLFADINFYNIQNSKIENKLLFSIQRNGSIHGMAGWFNLKLSEHYNLSTAADKTATHWKQAFFPFRDPIKVIRNDMLELTMSASGENPESDNCIIQYDYRCTQLANEINSGGKTGRNDPCPCGSGKKYKKCCGG